MIRSDVELNAKTALTELRGLLSGNTAEFGQFLIQKSKEWNFTINELLGAFEQLSAEFSKDNKVNKDVFRRVRKYLLNPTVNKDSVIDITLNPDDTNKLVPIIAKYIDLDTVGEMTGKEFAYKLFSEMDEDEIVYVSSIFVEDVTKLEPSEIVELCVKGMIRINLLGLLETHKSGLGK